MAITSTDAVTLGDAGRSFSGSSASADSRAHRYAWSAERSTRPTPDTCGAQSPRTRTVTCQATTTDADGGVTRADAADAACTETKPAESDACPTPAEGDACDDGNAETMNDACFLTSLTTGWMTLMLLTRFSSKPKKPKAISTI